jgi:hypothetical protein
MWETEHTINLKINKFLGLKGDEHRSEHIKMPLISVVGPKETLN